MPELLAKRLLQLFTTLFVLATLTFFLLRLLPGGPFDRARPLEPEVRAALEQRYGLDQPLPQQFARYLGGVVQLDFGPSYRFEGETVREILGRTLPVTLFLGAAALLVALLVGIPAGVLAASRPGGWLDFFVRSVAVSAMSLPSYLAGALLIYLFSLKLELLPAALWDGWSHRVLPVLALSFLPMAQIARLVRASLLENVHADFLRTARAKGAGEGAVLWRHGLRNSLLPLLTLLGPLTANTLTGTFVVETLFAIPGMGASFVDSVANRDYPLVMGLTLLYGFLLVAGNLLVDCAYGLADPRLRGRGGAS